MIILIATLKAPMSGREEALTIGIKEMAREYDLSVLAIEGRSGPGCYNFGIEVFGDRWKEFADVLTMALMPAKWTTTKTINPGFAYHV